MAKARATIGMAQAGAERPVRAPAACLQEAAHLSRVVAGQRSGCNDKIPPNSSLVDASAAAH